VSDIDFDELDKAVNSIMGNVKGGKDDAPKAKTLEVKDTLKPGEEPRYKKLDEVAQKIGNEALESEHEQTLVEHFEPTQSAEKPEYDKLGEIAKTIGSETLEDAVPNEKPAAAAESEPVEDKPVEAVKPVESQPVVVTKAPVAKPAAGGRFMDVVHPSSDMRTAPAPTATKPIVASSRLSITPLSSPTVTPAPVEDGAPTPFLPDANDKVEKRPLGAVPSPFTSEPEETSTPEKDAAEPSQPAAETSFTNGEVDTKKSEDSDDTQLNLNAAAMTSEPTAEEKALQEIEAKEVSAADLEPKDESIEKVESGDTEHLREMTDPKHAKTKGHDANATGAIYNVDEYHKPLSHPKKQKSGWGKVLIIILIIVIFAAFAGGAYFFLVGV